MAPISGLSGLSGGTPATSPDPANGSTATPAGRASHSDPEALTPTLPLASTSLPGVAIVSRHNTDLRTSSNVPDVPSTSPAVVPARLQSSLDPPASQSDCAHSVPGSLPSVSGIPLSLTTSYQDNFQTNENSEDAHTGALGGIGDTRLSDPAQWHPSVLDIVADSSRSPENTYTNSDAVVSY